LYFLVLPLNVSLGIRRFTVTSCLLSIFGSLSREPLPLVRCQYSASDHPNVWSFFIRALTRNCLLPRQFPVFKATEDPLIVTKAGHAVNLVSDSEDL
jgi:hypothetical protein